jgi:hypothetical protein
MTSGCLDRATVQLSSSMLRITGKTSPRSEGRLRSGVGASDWKSARIGANFTDPSGASRSNPADAVSVTV